MDALLTIKNAVLWNENSGYSFSKGSRNFFIHRASCMCARFGVSIWDVENYFQSWSQNDFPKNEIITCIRSAYRTNKPINQPINQPKHKQPLQSIKNSCQIKKNNNMKVLKNTTAKGKDFLNDNVISMFSNIKSLQVQDISLLNALNAIKNGNYANEIKHLRSLSGAENKSYKETLSGFLFSGQFTERKSDKIIAYSKIICIDIDKLDPETLIEKRNKIKLDDFTLAVWISPNGNGLKVLIPVNTELKDHVNTFLAIQQYYKDVHDIEIDTVCKDVVRACFVSSDPEMIINEETVCLFDYDRDSISSQSEELTLLKKHYKLLNEFKKAKEQKEYWNNHYETVRKEYNDISNKISELKIA